MMDLHRHELIVIVAGYPKEMENLIDSNPGLKYVITPYSEVNEAKVKETKEVKKVKEAQDVKEMSEHAREPKQVKEAKEMRCEG